MKMSDETRCKVRYKRVSTDLYIGGTSPIGTCIYGKGNMYGKGNVSLTEITERWSEKNSSVDACSRFGGTLDHKLVLFRSLTTSSVVLYIPFLSFFQSYLVIKASNSKKSGS